MCLHRTFQSNGSQELKEVNETYKHSMYRALAWTLGTFVTLFTTLTVAMLAAEGSQTQSWEWKFEWINVVSWEVRFAKGTYGGNFWTHSPASEGKIAMFVHVNVCRGDLVFQAFDCASQCCGNTSGEG